MDPIENPFTPGAGTPPPELAGRDGIREAIRVAIERVRRGRSAKSALMVGLRGVGKTVLLDRMRLDAEHTGILTLRIEAPEDRSLPGILAPELRQVLLKLSLNHRAADYGKRALQALAGFVKALKVKYQDIEVGLDYAAEPGLADNGDLQHDLRDLLQATGEAAQKAETAIVIFIDELQYVDELQLAALITALHTISQRGLPVILIGAGLPNLRGNTGKAKSYAERLFEFPSIGALPQPAAEQAIVVPLHNEGVKIDADALSVIISKTRGYPYFLQEWGKQSWDVAPGSPIRKQDVDRASEIAIAALDASFFGVRFDRLTNAEKKYLRAMAALGVGPHRSGDIAKELKRAVTSLGPVRNTLISKGMVWSPSHASTAFTVPLFDEYMKRIISDNDFEADTVIDEIDRHVRKTSRAHSRWRRKK
jgi:hypothetical protein